MTALDPFAGGLDYPALQSSQPEHPATTAWTQPTRTWRKHTSAGWYPDPTGRHESRYFNGLWTPHVSTRGVNSIDPLTAVSAPAASTPFGAPTYTPHGPATQSGPSLPHQPSAASAGQRSPKVMLAAGGAVAVAVGITLAVSLSGGGSSGHGFCADVRALNERYPSARVVAADIERNPSQISDMINRLDTLAAESPTPQDAADLRTVARFVRDFGSGNYAAAEAEMTQAEAAGNRIDAYATDKCGRRSS